MLGTNGKLPDVNTISQLKYLDCVFKESLRLYPPAPIVARSAGEPIQLGKNSVAYVYYELLVKSKNLYVILFY